MVWIVALPELRCNSVIDSWEDDIPAVNETILGQFGVVQGTSFSWWSALRVRPTLSCIADVW